MTTHYCPIPGCKRKICRPLLMCRDHWYQVPLDVRRAVWRLYDRAPGSDAHRAAVSAAIAAVQARDDAP
jgi:hypothetical protein